MSPRIARISPRNGVALVITLVLLSVILVVTFTLLALSRRERASVTTAQHLIDAEYMANAGFERAKATVAAQILGRTNMAAGGFATPIYQTYNTNTFQFFNAIERRVGGDLLVSSSQGPTDPRAYTADFIARLQTPELGGGGGGGFGGFNETRDARVPVFVRTNRTLPNAPLDFRFYLDLNRNGTFESNGFFPLIDMNERPVPGATPTSVIEYYHTGDPEWIGMTAQAGLPHSPTNRFIGRYAYAVVPAGRTLDINTIHNDAGNNAFNAADGFGRNQGYGTYEINLAAFLAELNTNSWGRLQYNYDFPAPWGQGSGIGPGRATGLAFDDARSILQYRYGGDVGTLPTLDQWLRPDAAFRALTAWRNDYIDNIGNDPNDDIARSAGGVQFENDFIDPTTRWPGADNTNRFNSIHDLYRTSKTFTRSSPNYTNFVNRLRQASLGPGSYNRYTFYRLLSQLGTDTGPGPVGRINLNFSSSGTNRSTDFRPWNPTDFFMNVADRLIRQTFTNFPGNDYYTLNYGYRFSATNGPVPLFSYLAGDQPTLSVTNIPIYPTNLYNAAIHRSLQVAANLFEANNTNFVGPITPGRPDLAAVLPNIFRPVFAQSGARIWISRYERVTNSSDIVLAQKWYHFDELDGVKLRDTDNIYGIPWVVAAQKGYPNLNEIGLASTVTVERKLDIVKKAIKSPPVSTNELFIMGISNVFGVELWNPYTNRFPRALRTVVRGRLSMTLTNSDSRTFQRVGVSNYFATGVIPANSWAGVGTTGQRATASQAGSFRFPILTNLTFLPPMGYRGDNQTFVPSTNPVYSATSQGFYAPKWVYRTTNDFLFFLVDDNSRRIVDVVTMNRLETFFDISEAMQPENYVPVQGSEGSKNLWSTRRVNGRPASDLTQKDIPTEGVVRQMNISAGLGELANDWNDPATSSGNPSIPLERENFRRFVLGQTEVGASNIVSLEKQAPYSPSAKFLHDVSWQVNDPLVHHIIDHFLHVEPVGNTVIFTNYSAAPIPILMGWPATNRNFGVINAPYTPWGGSPLRQSSGADEALAGNTMRVEVMDPLIRSVNDWQFPTNAYPSVGWIGRVHRGTPWQSVYLKAQGGGSNELWLRHVGSDVGRLWLDYDPILRKDVYRVSWLSHPTNDWSLVDLFTVAPGENATTGQIGINQVGLAAWSAVLSGVTVLTNYASDDLAKVRNMRGQAPLVTNLVIQPSFGDPTSPMNRLVNAINRYRAGLTNGLFMRAGDILAVPELTLNSPWLRLNNDQRAYGLTDEAYERIPRQILSLVRPDEARYVIYAFGQALQPAPDSLIKNPLSPHYNLCTNYQIMAEVATKTVLRFENVGGVVNGRPQFVLKPVIESFSQLPPE